MIYRIIASGAIVIIGCVLRGIVISSIQRKVRRQVLKPQSALLARKIITVFIVLIAVLALGFTWGVSPRNIWAAVASFAVLVAIAFFGVWSILNNVVAGLILLISRPFDVGDEVILYPENIQCRVVNITTVFLVLEDSEGAVITVPNNFVFQRIFKRVRKKGA